MQQLFDLPEYDDAFHFFVHRAIHELRHRKDPVLSRISAELSDDINTSQYTMPSGEMVENKPFKFRIPFAIEFDEVIIGRSSKLIEAINNAAEESEGMISSPKVNMKEGWLSLSFKPKPHREEASPCRSK